MRSLLVAIGLAFAAALAACGRAADCASPICLLFASDDPAPAAKPTNPDAQVECSGPDCTEKQAGGEAFAAEK